LLILNQLHQIKFAKKNLKGKICLSPFNSMHINTAGQVNICLCPAWQPMVVGNIFESSLPEILASESAQRIRQSIIDGTYEYCNEKQCPLLINDQLNTRDTTPSNIQKLLENSQQFEMPYEISFHGDLTCNLSCPSCRTSVIRVPDSQMVQQQVLADTVLKNLFAHPTQQPINFITSGAGEVFASPLLLHMLENLPVHDFPNLKLNLHTNGLLAPKRWSRIAHIESHVRQVTVSVDAAEADTYAQIRRGGLWQDLVSAMEFLQHKKTQLGFELHARMIVQAKNYQEIVKFYELCQSWSVDRVEYSRLLDWRTWSRPEFRANDVFDTVHAERSQARLLIDQVRNRPGVWLEGNFN
jgi:Iron-sulfur cluster-binding domain/Radical SAM superfamily